VKSKKEKTSNILRCGEEFETRRRDENCRLVFCWRRKKRVDKKKTARKLNVSRRRGRPTKAGKTRQKKSEANQKSRGCRFTRKQNVGGLKD